MIGVFNGWNRVSRIQEGVLVGFAEKDEDQRSIKKKKVASIRDSEMQSESTSIVKRLGRFFFPSFHAAIEVC